MLNFEQQGHAVDEFSGFPRGQVAARDFGSLKMTDMAIGGRQAVLSPFQAAALRGYLRGYQEGYGTANRYLEAISTVESLSQESVVPPTPWLLPISLAEARTLVYTSLLQAGVSRLELSFPDASEMPTERYLQQRLRVHRGPEVAEIFMVVNFAFGSYLPDFDKSPQWKEARHLALYVFDLLFALRRGKSMVNILSPGNVEATVRALPAPLAVPLANLFESMTHVEPEVVAPRVLVDVDNLALFQEILAETTFAEYERAHARLELSGVPLDDELTFIQKTAVRLCSRTTRVLQVRKIAATLLPTGSGVLEKGLGTLPGKLAEVAVAAAEPWLKSRRQMVIYDLSSSLHSLLSNLSGSGEGSSRQRR